MMISESDYAKKMEWLKSCPTERCALCGYYGKDGCCREGYPGRLGQVRRDEVYG